MIILYRIIKTSLELDCNYTITVNFKQSKAIDSVAVIAKKERR